MGTEIRFAEVETVAETVVEVMAGTWIWETVAAFVLVLTRTGPWVGKRLKSFQILGASAPEVRRRSHDVLIGEIK